MGRPAPSFPPARLEYFDSWIGQQDEDGGDCGELQSFLLRLLSKSSGGYERRYAMDLEKSFKSLHNRAEGRLSRSPKALKPLLEEYLTRCKNHVDEVYQIIRCCLEAETSTTRELAYKAKMWPRLSTISLL